MSRWRTVLLIFVGLVTCPLVARAQSRSTANLLPSERELNRYGLVLEWHNHAVMNPNRDHVLHLTSDEEMLYVQSTVGTITAFDLETGIRRWAIQLGRRDRTSQPAVSNAETVFVVSGMQLYAIEKDTGRTRWMIELPASPSTSPAIDEKRIYIGTLNGSVFALELAKIRKLYDLQRLPQWSHQTVVWRYQADDEITTPPIVSGSIVNFASRSGSLYAVSATDRKLVFQFETDKPISAPMASSGRMLFVASEDYNFYGIDAANGSVKWEFVTGLPIRRQPVVIEDRVYISPSRGGLYSLRANTGRQLWWAPKASGFLAASESMVYASDPSGDVLLLSREDGEPRGALQMRDFSVRYANNRTDRLFLATDSGRVICIRETGSDFPHYYLHPEREPILPQFAPEESTSTEPEPQP